MPLEFNPPFRTWPDDSLPSSVDTVSPAHVGIRNRVQESLSVKRLASWPDLGHGRPTSSLEQRLAEISDHFTVGSFPFVVMPLKFCLLFGSWSDDWLPYLVSGGIKHDSLTFLPNTMSGIVVAYFRQFQMQIPLRAGCPVGPSLSPLLGQSQDLKNQDKNTCPLGSYNHLLSTVNFLTILAFLLQDPTSWMASPMPAYFLTLLESGTSQIKVGAGFVALFFDAPDQLLPMSWRDLGSVQWWIPDTSMSSMQNTLLIGVMSLCNGCLCS